LDVGAFCVWRGHECQRGGGSFELMEILSQDIAAGRLGVPRVCPEASNLMIAHIRSPGLAGGLRQLAGGMEQFLA